MRDRSGKGGRLTTQTKRHWAATGPTHEAVRELIEQGLTVREIAAELNSSAGTIQARARELGLTAATELARRQLPDSAIVEAFERLGSLSGVRIETRCGKARIVAVLTAAGIDLSDRRARPAPRDNAWTDEEDTRLQTLVSQGLPWRKIERQFDRSMSALKTRAGELGLSLRNARLAQLGLPPRVAQQSMVEEVEVEVEVDRDQTPPPRDWAELSDSIARWGVCGAADEYEVSAQQIMRWRLEFCGREA